MKPKAIISIEKQFLDQVFSESIRTRMGELVELLGVYTEEDNLRDDTDILSKVEYLFTGWGSIQVDEDVLTKAPSLKAIFSATGTVKDVTSEAFWKRDDLLITNAAHANAVPVAEYCLATILFSLKLGWRHIRNVRRTRKWGWEPSIPGAYGTKVGLVSLGEIGRKTLELLQPFDLDLMVYSTSLTEEQATNMGVRLVTLETMFEEAYVISLHTPNLPSTRGMINHSLLNRMKTDATLINSARGAIINEDNLIEVLSVRQDLTAVLDVVDPEPPELESPLFDLDNVVLTPHIAGSVHGETQRLAKYALESCREYQEGKTPQWTVTREQFERMA